MRQCYFRFALLLIVCATSISVAWAQSVEQTSSPGGAAGQQPGAQAQPAPKPEGADLIDPRLSPQSSRQNPAAPQPNPEKQKSKAQKTEAGKPGAEARSAAPANPAGKSPSPTAAGNNKGPSQAHTGNNSPAESGAETGRLDIGRELARTVEAKTGDQERLQLLDSKEGERSQSNMLGTSLRMIGGFLLVMSLMLLCLFALRRYGPLRFRSASGEIMSIISTLPLGDKRNLTLLRVGGEVLLLGSTVHEIKLLTRINSGAVEQIKDNLESKALAEAGTAFASQMERQFSTLLKDEPKRLKESNMTGTLARLSDIRKSLKAK